MDSVTTKRAVATAKKCHQRCRYSGETHVRTWKNRRHEGVDRKPKKDVTKYCRHRTVVRRVPCGEIAPLRNTRGVDDVKRGRTGSFVFSCRMHRLQGQQCRIGRCTHTHTPPNSSVFAACVCVVVYARTCQVDRELWRYYLEKVNGDPWEYQNGDKAPPLCA